MKFLKLWFPVILYSGGIFYISSIPNVRTPLPEIRFDLILHILVYTPFGFLVARGIFGSQSSVSWKMLLFLTFLISFLYGASDEYHQFFVVGRDSEIIDLLADTIGGLIGGTIFLLRINKNRNS